MSTVTQKFVLVGAHAGKTLRVNGHEFIDGEFVFQGSHESMATLSRIFSFYDAIPEQEAIAAEQAAELTALRAQATGKVAPVAPVPAVPPGPIQYVEVAPVPGKPTLAEAIGLLNPEEELHWTSNNLPSLQYLTEVTGKAVSRTDVDAVADGYTRAKARTAKSAS